MDIEFLVNDTFALTRPQWKIVTDLEEAGKLFADAVAQNYKSDETDKAMEQEEAEEDLSSDGADADDLAPELDEHHSSSEEVETEVGKPTYFWIASLTSSIGCPKC